MVPILVADRNSRIIFTNAALCKLIDCEEHELVEKALFDFLDPESQVLSDRFADPDKIREPIFHSGIFNTPRGNKVRLTFKIYPVFDEANERVLYHVTVGVDSKAVRAIRVVSAEDDALRESYTRTSLRYREGKELFDRVKAYMKEEQGFLDSDLDQDTLSRLLGTNQLYLSQTVNFFSGLSFRDYINHQRISFISGQPELFMELSISELWKRSGFGSYSAFRRFVQATYGQRPNEWLLAIRSVHAKEKSSENA